MRVSRLWASINAVVSTRPSDAARGRQWKRCDARRPPRNRHRVQTYRKVRYYFGFENRYRTDENAVEKNGQETRELWWMERREERKGISGDGKRVWFLLICLLLLQARPGVTGVCLPSSGLWGGNHARPGRLLPSRTPRVHLGKEMTCTHNRGSIVHIVVFEPLVARQLRINLRVGLRRYPYLWHMVHEISFPVPALIRDRFHVPELAPGARGPGGGPLLESKLTLVCARYRWTPRVLARIIAPGIFLIEICLALSCTP